MHIASQTKKMSVLRNRVQLTEKMGRERASHQGLTLIELLVVLSIVGILFGAGVLTFTHVQKRSRDARRRVDVQAIAQAYEQRVSSGYAPYGSSNTSTSSWWTDGVTHLGLTQNFPSGLLPLDPINGLGSDGQMYEYRIVSIFKSHPTMAASQDPSDRMCILARLELPNGNCTGYYPSTDMVNLYKCIYTSSGTGGTHYCVSNRSF